LPTSYIHGGKERDRRRNQQQRLISGQIFYRRPTHSAIRQCVNSYLAQLPGKKKALPSADGLTDDGYVDEPRPRTQSLQRPWCAGFQVVLLAPSFDGVLLFPGNSAEGNGHIHSRFSSIPTGTLFRGRFNPTARRVTSRAAKSPNRTRPIASITNHNLAHDPGQDPRTLSEGRLLSKRSRFSSQESGIHREEELSVQGRRPQRRVHFQLFPNVAVQELYDSFFRVYPLLWSSAIGWIQSSLSKSSLWQMN